MKAPLEQARAELRASRAALERMRAATTFDPFEDAWREFLGSIDKVWTKVERACQHLRSNFEPWQGQYKRLRRDDELLRYLTHARNADTHTIQEIVERRPGTSTIGPVGFGRQGWHIESMTIVSGQLIEYRGNLPIEQRTYPARLELLPVVDRGVRYHPPANHLGNRLERRDPLTIGELGWQFYSDYVVKAEEKFFSSGR